MLECIKASQSVVSAYVRELNCSTIYFFSLFYIHTYIHMASSQTCKPCHGTTTTEYYETQQHKKIISSDKHLGASCNSTAVHKHHDGHNSSGNNSLLHGHRGHHSPSHQEHGRGGSFTEKLGQLTHVFHKKKNNREGARCHDGSSSSSSSDSESDHDGLSERRKRC